VNALVFWFFLAHHVALRCGHGKWDMSLDDGTLSEVFVVSDYCWCIICDSGMST
jgi:hypothetical protein